MRHRLLRLFWEYRRLEQAEIDRIKLQDRLNWIEGENNRLRDQLTEARNGERQALHAMVNIEYQKNYGVLPYPDAPHFPPERWEAQGTEPIGRGAELSSSIVRKAQAAFREKALAMRERAMNE